jgi:hypothetical protein
MFLPGKRQKAVPMRNSPIIGGFPLLLRLLGGFLGHDDLTAVIIAAVAANVMGELGLFASGALDNRGSLKLPVGQTRTRAGLGMSSLW